MVTDNVALHDAGRFAQIDEIGREKLIKAAENACAKLEALIRKNGTAFPDVCSKDYRYVYGENNNWECGMYTGCIWLAYEITGDRFFKDAAEAQLASYKRRIDENIEMDDHDVGFVFSPSCVAAYKLTGNEQARQYALDAAKYFYEHSYSKEGKFIIRYWKAWNDGWGCRTMMDSLLNAPLLFWAAKETGNEDYFRAALDHNLTTTKYLVRNDGSTFHHYQFDPKTAKPVKGITFQGYADDSCWSRGHSWGVYGFPIAYSYCKNEELAKTHKDVTYYMLNTLPDDNITYWDYVFTQGSDEPRDSSAGAISVCGMLEMAKHLPDSAEQKNIFLSASAKMMNALIDGCTGMEAYEYDGLICHVTHAKPFGYAIDECAVYGDYFYLEALARYLKPDREMYW